jgi:hypothetical protein
LSPALRQKILFVHGGDPGNLPYLYTLMNHQNGPDLIETLRKKGLRGSALTEFVLEDCEGQPLKFLKWAIAETLKVNTPKTPKVLGNGLYR